MSGIFLINGLETNVTVGLLNNSNQKGKILVFDRGGKNG
jgi:hypothetical protein